MLEFELYFLIENSFYAYMNLKVNLKIKLNKIFDKA
jgi:hypothetical protein